MAGNVAVDAVARSDVADCCFVAGKKCISDNSTSFHSHSYHPMQLSTSSNSTNISTLIPLGRLLNIVVFVGVRLLGTAVFVAGSLCRPLRGLLRLVGRFVLFVLHVVAMLQVLGQFLFGL